MKNKITKTTIIGLIFVVFFISSSAQVVFSDSLIDDSAIELTENFKFGNTTIAQGSKVLSQNGDSFIDDSVVNQLENFRFGSGDASEATVVNRTVSEYQFTGSYIDSTVAGLLNNFKFFKK